MSATTMDPVKAALLAACEEFEYARLHGYRAADMARAERRLFEALALVRQA